MQLQLENQTGAVDRFRRREELERAQGRRSANEIGHGVVRCGGAAGNSY
jgi:hypothetical protein